MRNLLLPIFIISILLTGCSANQSSKRTSKELRGWYTIKLQNSEALFDSIKAEGDFGEKLFGSFASLLKVKICFQENGYMKLGGNFGLIDFTTNLKDGDSTKYEVIGDTLYLENANINDRDFLLLNREENGVFSTKIDSGSFLLIPE